MTIDVASAVNAVLQNNKGDGVQGVGSIQL